MVGWNYASSGASLPSGQGAGRSRGRGGGGGAPSAAGTPTASRRTSPVPGHRRAISSRTGTPLEMRERRTSAIL